MAKRPKVLIADKIADEGIELLRAGGVEPVLEHAPSAAELVRQMRKVDAVVVRSATKIPEAAFGPKTSVKVIGRAGIGVDNIDVDAATAHGIAVLNTPDANAGTTAELALAHMFSLARNLTTADATVKAGKWEKSKLTGTEIAGKTIGVLGYGTIGRIVAQRCRGLAMKVFICDPFVNDSKVIDDGFEPVKLAKLLKEADFITVHTPGTKETFGLIGKAELRKMKKSSYLMQCARGGIVDEKALAQALRAGEIAGAAVDVFTAEPLPADHVLRGVPNIVFSPHLGASTAEAQRATGVAIARQISHYFATGEVVNAVNLPRIPSDQLQLAQPYLPLARGLGKLIGALNQENACNLELSLQGQAAELPASLLIAEVLAGILSRTLSIPVNQVNAASLAERQGIAVSVSRKQDIQDFATLIELRLHCGKHEHQIAGTLLGAQPRLAYFDGIEVEAPLEGPVLLTLHQDKVGVIAKLSKMLADKRINIANMHVGSDPKRKRAVALLGLDKELDEKTLNAINKLGIIEQTIHLKL